MSGWGEFSPEWTAANAEMLSERAHDRAALHDPEPDDEPAAFIVIWHTREITPEAGE